MSNCMDCAGCGVDCNDCPMCASHPDMGAGYAAWPYAAKGYSILPASGLVPYVPDQDFPIGGPLGTDWELLQTQFLSAWDSAPDGTYQWVADRFTTANFGDVDFSSVGANLEQGFANQGEGTPLAFRLWHHTILDVAVPMTYTLPDFIPFGLGGTHDIPLIGGQQIASLHEWEFQIIYHNAIPALVVVALILLALGIAAIVLVSYMSQGDVPLTTAVKQFVQQFTPATIASSITTVLVLGIGMIVALSIAVPQLSTSLSAGVKAGPLTVGAGAGGGGGNRGSSRSR